MMLSGECGTGGITCTYNRGSIDLGVTVSVLGGMYGIPYIKMAGCMEHKDRRILFGLQDGERCATFSLATGLDWNLQKFLY